MARAGHVVGRLGGDEFCVVLHHVGKHDDGLAAAGRCLAVFSDPFVLKGVSLLTSASIGLVFAGDVPSSPAELMRNADLAMYDAKRRARSDLDLSARAA